MILYRDVTSNLNKLLYINYYVAIVFIDCTAKIKVFLSVVFIV